MHVARIIIQSMEVSILFVIFIISEKFCVWNQSFMVNTKRMIAQQQLQQLNAHDYLLYTYVYHACVLSGDISDFSAPINSASTHLQKMFFSLSFNRHRNNVKNCNKCTRF